MKSFKTKYSSLKNQHAVQTLARRHAFIATALISVLVFFMATGSLVFGNTHRVGANDVYIVDIFSEGTTRSVPTRSKTVADLLINLEIELGEYDVVEPGLGATIAEDNFQVSIFKSRPISVRDGQQINRFQSAYSEPLVMAKNAGYILAPEDRVEWAGDTEQNLAIADLAPRIIITRANVYSINLYGDIFEKRSHSTDAYIVLSEAGVVLNEGDEVAASTVLVGGEQIVISRFGTQIVTVEEEIAFKTTSTKDPALDLGVTNVTTKGVVGRKTVTYELELENDVEISRKILQEIVTNEPVTQVQVKGSKPPKVVGNVSGEKQFWMESAGIAQSDWGYVDFIISHESGWRHTVYNGSGSGAYGLCQALPGSKMATAGSDWKTNPATQLRWCNGYASARYGGWGGAYSFWIANKWW